MGVISVLGGWRHERFGAALVAGVTRHVLLSVRKGAVDCARHRDHPAGDLLRPLLVGGSVLDVVVGARALVEQAQCLDEGLHCLGDRRSTKHLNVLAATATSSPSESSRWSSWAPSTLAASSTVSARGRARRSGGLIASRPSRRRGGPLCAALGFLGEQYKAHHREETENKQEFEVLHDVLVGLANCRSIVWVLKAIVGRVATSYRESARTQLHC